MNKILILASNPRKDLNLPREIYFLKNIIERSKDKTQFDVAIGEAVRPKDLQKLFLEHQPRIVHFCGHGTGMTGLVLEDDAGREQLVSTHALSNLFKAFANKIECVLLNACYTEVQANAIVEHINYVIGMSQEIQDNAAIYFTRGFYQALGNGQPIEQCYRLGCNEIELEIYKAEDTRSGVSKAERKLSPVDAGNSVILPEHLKPILRIKSNLIPFPRQKTFHDEVAYQRYRQDVQNDFNLGQTIPTRGKRLTSQEKRQRKSLLTNVKSSWIEGFLEMSLYNRTLLKLDIEGRPDAVQRPSSGREELPIEPEQSFQWLRAADIFNQMGTGRTLLILGEPGAGKTIELLKLAQRLIERTEQDLTRSIPVVFNLSSWSSKRQSIVEWLVEELKDKYLISKSLSKTWIEQEQLILLLDGLDEVHAKYRDDCVRALNQFLENHSTTEIVVCSRIQDYNNLSERLKLRSAIYIRPITSEYIDWYLEDVGAPLAGLKTVLKQEKELEEFAKTPLILNVMSWAYRGYSATDVSRELSSVEKRNRQLFNTYIERMLQRRGATFFCRKERTKLWLKWLAQRMIESSQPVFLIERMQPNWLKDKIQQTIYYTGSLIGLGLILGFGLTETYLIMSTVGRVFSVWYYVIVFALFVGTIYVVFQGLISLIINLVKREIKTFEIISWSWQKAIKGLAAGSGFTLFLGLILGRGNSLDWVVILGLINGIMGGIWGGIRGIDSEIQVVPNEGVWRSAKNAGLIGIISGLFFGIIGNFAFGLIKGSIIGFIFGLNFGIANGGKACIQHFILRLILCLKGLIPWNYAYFLDYATERIFLQKVGGGYIFVHRMLMEHFAQMKLDEITTPE